MAETACAPQRARLWTLRIACVAVLVVTLAFIGVAIHIYTALPATGAGIGGVATVFDAQLQAVRVRDGGRFVDVTLPLAVKNMLPTGVALQDVAVSVRRPAARAAAAIVAEVLVEGGGATFAAGVADAPLGVSLRLHVDAARELLVDAAAAASNMVAAAADDGGSGSCSAGAAAATQQLLAGAALDVQVDLAASIAPTALAPFALGVTSTVSLQLGALLRDAVDRVVRKHAQRRMTPYQDPETGAGAWSFSELLDDILSRAESPPATLLDAYAAQLGKGSLQLAAPLQLRTNLLEQMAAARPLKVAGDASAPMWRELYDRVPQIALPLPAAAYRDSYLALAHLDTRNVLAPTGMNVSALLCAVAANSSDAERWILARDIAALRNASMTPGTVTATQSAALSRSISQRASQQPFAANPQHCAQSLARKLHWSDGAFMLELALGLPVTGTCNRTTHPVATAGVFLDDEFSVLSAGFSVDELSLLPLRALISHVALGLPLPSNVSATVAAAGAATAADAGDTRWSCRAGHVPVILRVPGGAPAAGSRHAFARVLDGVTVCLRPGGVSSAIDDALAAARVARAEAACNASAAELPTTAVLYARADDAGVLVSSTSASAKLLPAGNASQSCAAADGGLQLRAAEISSMLTGIEPVSSTRIAMPLVDDDASTAPPTTTVRASSPVTPLAAGSSSGRRLALDPSTDPSVERFGGLAGLLANMFTSQVSISGVEDVVLETRDANSSRFVAAQDRCAHLLNDAGIAAPAAACWSAHKAASGRAPRFTGSPSVALSMSIVGDHKGLRAIAFQADGDPLPLDLPVLVLDAADVTAAAGLSGTVRGRAEVNTTRRAAAVVQACLWMVPAGVNMINNPSASFGGPANVDLAAGQGFALRARLVITVVDPSAFFADDVLLGSEASGVATATAVVSAAAAASSAAAGNVAAGGRSIFDLLLNGATRAFNEPLDSPTTSSAFQGSLVNGLLASGAFYMRVLDEAAAFALVSRQCGAVAGTQPKLQPLLYRALSGLRADLSMPATCLTRASAEGTSGAVVDDDASGLSTTTAGAPAAASAAAASALVASAMAAVDAAGAVHSLLAAPSAEAAALAFASSLLATAANSSISSVSAVASLLASTTAVAETPRFKGAGTTLNQLMLADSASAVFATSGWAASPAAPTVSGLTDAELAANVTAVCRVGTDSRGRAQFAPLQRSDCQLLLRVSPAELFARSASANTTACALALLAGCQHLLQGPTSQLSLSRSVDIPTLVFSAPRADLGRELRTDIVVVLPTTHATPAMLANASDLVAGSFYLRVQSSSPSLGMSRIGMSLTANTGTDLVVDCTPFAALPSCPTDASGASSRPAQAGLANSSDFGSALLYGAWLTRTKATAVLRGVLGGLPASFPYRAFDTARARVDQVIVPVADAVAGLVAASAGQRGGLNTTVSQAVLGAPLLRAVPPIMARPHHFVRPHVYATANGNVSLGMLLINPLPSAVLLDAVCGVEVDAVLNLTMGGEAFLVRAVFAPADDAPPTGGRLTACFSVNATIGGATATQFLVNDVAPYVAATDATSANAGRTWTSRVLSRQRPTTLAGLWFLDLAAATDVSTSVLLDSRIGTRHVSLPLVLRALEIPAAAAAVLGVPMNGQSSGAEILCADASAASPSRAICSLAQSVIAGTATNVTAFTRRGQLLPPAPQPICTLLPAPVSSTACVAHAPSLARATAVGTPTAAADSIAWDLFANTPAQPAWLHVAAGIVYVRVGSSTRSTAPIGVLVSPSRAVDTGIGHSHDLAPVAAVVRALTALPATWSSRALRITKPTGTCISAPIAAPAAPPAATTAASADAPSRVQVTFQARLLPASAGFLAFLVLSNVILAVWCGVECFLARRQRKVASCEPAASGTSSPPTSTAPPPSAKVCASDDVLPPTPLQHSDPVTTFPARDNPLFSSSRVKVGGRTTRHNTADDQRAITDDALPAIDSSAVGAGPAVAARVDVHVQPEQHA